MLFLCTLSCAKRKFLDFFNAHALTSLHFTRIMIEKMHDKKLQFQLLRNQFLGLMLIYCVQGRPEIIIKKGSIPNLPWSDSIQKSIDIDDEHVCKIVRIMHIAEGLFGYQDGWWQSVAAASVVYIEKIPDWTFDGWVLERDGLIALSKL